MSTELARGAEYALSLIDAGVVRLTVRGHPIADLRVASGCDTTSALDRVGALEGPDIEQTAAGCVITWRGVTSEWPRVEYRFTCREDHARFGYRLIGRGAVDRARYFCSAERYSRSHGASLFNPEPTSSARQRFAIGELARVGVSSDKAYQGGNWFFTPGPLCFVLDGAADDVCLAVGVAEAPGRLQFSDFEALPSEAGNFGLGLTYAGHVFVDGEWSSPELVLLPSTEPYTAVRRYCDWLRAHDLAPQPRQREVPGWWREPIFCGWGEQVNQSAGPGSTTRAANHSTRANYERWLGILESRSIHPGTVVVDDKWQTTYGANAFDEAKWPDARGFIDAQHQRGRRVLLWLRAWATEGLPADECVVDAHGDPVAADPTHPATAARLRASIRRMLLDYDADGFKLDFTHRGPVGSGLRTWSGAWGVDLMLEFMQLVHDEMRQAKPDALLMAHTANPAFANVVDMLRLNDVPGVAGEPKSYLAPMQHRARIAHAAGPGWLIDTDNWPSPDRHSFLEYLEAQPRLGVPSLYFATGTGWQSPGEGWRWEPFSESDYAAVRRAWAAYRRQAGLPDRG